MSKTLFSTDFESETLGQLPAHFTAAVGTWAIVDSLGGRGLGDTSSKQFDCLLDTGTPEVAQDIQTYSWTNNGGSKAPCPVWRSDPTFANAYLTNFDMSAGNLLYFKRSGGNYGGATQFPFTAPALANADLVRLERRMLDTGAVEIRIWNATKGARPDAATVTIPPDTNQPYATGSSGVFTSNSGVAPLEDYLYEDAAGTSTPTPAPTIIDRLDAALTWSPYNWDDDGTSHNSALPGATLRFGFTGTSLRLALTPLSGLNNYPVVRAWIDDKPPVDVAITAGATSISIATGLAAGVHRVRLMLLRVDDFSSGRWSGANALKIKGVVVDNGEGITASTRRSRYIIFYGDSLTQGVHLLSAIDFFGDDASFTIPALIGEALDAEVGAVGYGGQAFNAAGVGDNPSFMNGYDKHFAGRSRLVNGLLSPAPDVAYIMLGTNPLPGNASQAQVAAAINALRAVAPTTRIMMVVPPGGYSRAGITAATNAAIAAGDTRITLVDAGAAADAGLNTNVETSGATDGVHLKAITNARRAAFIAAETRHAIEPRRFTVVPA